MLARLGTRGRDIDYTHRPPIEQLSNLGIRKFEPDVFADPMAGATPSRAHCEWSKALKPD